MQYALKLKSNPLNQTYETVFEPQYKTLFQNKPNMIPSFGIRISSEFEKMNLDLDNIAEFKVPDVPPWTFSQPRVLFSLHNDKKSQTDPLVFRTKYHELLSNFPSYETIFTDGSKDGDTAGSACVTPSDTYKCRLPDNASIFSAEIKAIDLALDHIEESRSSDFIIFSDSLSVLQSLHNRHIENPLLFGAGPRSAIGGHLTRKSGVLGSIPGLATYFRFSLRFFKKGSCQVLAKVCAQSTG